MKISSQLHVQWFTLVLEIHHGQFSIDHESIYTIELAKPMNQGLIYCFADSETTNNTD